MASDHQKRTVSRCKCVVVGDTGVGKSFVIRSLIGGDTRIRDKTDRMTAGVEVSRKTVTRAQDLEPTFDQGTTVDDMKQKQALEFFIFEFSGRKLYWDLLQQIWRLNNSGDEKVTAVVGVFDVNREKSFSELQSLLNHWLNMNQPRVVGIVFGNKGSGSHDSKSIRNRFRQQEVTQEEAQVLLSKKYQMRYFKVEDERLGDKSARHPAAEVVQEAFSHLTESWFQMHNQ